MTNIDTISETEKLRFFNKILYILHLSLVDIRREAFNGSNCDVKKIEDIADAFEPMPTYMFMWSDNWKEAVFDNIEYLQKKYGCRCRDYLEILNMDYSFFLKKYFSFTLDPDEAITFPQDVK